MPNHPAAINCIVVLGATATGKTRLAVQLANACNGEIISVDSRQVYRGMDLGTGKDLADYGAIPYHLIDVAEPHESYNLFRYLAEARAALLAISARQRLPILAGGTPLYLNAVLDGYAMHGGEPDPLLRAELEAYDSETLCRMLQAEAPEVFARTDTSQRRRVLRGLEIARSSQRSATTPRPQLPLRPLLLAPYYPRQVVHQRIAERLDARLEAGMIAEVQHLHDVMGVSWEQLDFFGLEYRYIARYLQGQIDLTAMRETLLARIRRLCKSQDIWYRKMEREGKQIHWLANGELAPAITLAEQFLAGATLAPPSWRMMDNLNGPQTNFERNT